MYFNDILHNDLERIRKEAFERIVPAAGIENTDALEKVIFNELKQTFAIYDVPFNEDTFKAAIVSAIWSGGATEKIFGSNPNPCPPHTNTTRGIANHGVLVALAAFMKITPLVEKEFENKKIQEALDASPGGDNPPEHALNQDLPGTHDHSDFLGGPDYNDPSNFS